MEALTKLNKIPEYGRVLYNGGHFSIKYRLRVGNVLKIALDMLKKKYPELIIYNTREGFVIFGGTFSKQSSFLSDKEALIGK